jgi:hypothetical protein
MVLSTHALVGAGIGAHFSSSPAVAMTFGFASHFVLDAIPHWDYPIRSASLTPDRGVPMQLDRALVVDLLTIGVDALVGVAVAMMLFGSVDNRWSVLLGAIGAMLPDPLQILHNRYPHEPLRTLQRFHRAVHSKLQLAALPFGITSQLVLVMAVVCLSKGAQGAVLEILAACSYG